MAMDVDLDVTLTYNYGLRNAREFTKVAPEAGQHGQVSLTLSGKTYAMSMAALCAAYATYHV